MSTTPDHDPDHDRDPVPDLLLRYLAETRDLMTVVDDQGVFLYVNHVAEEVLGLPDRECVGRSAFEFVHEDDREATRAAFASWSADPAVEIPPCGNRQVNLADGTVRHVRWTIYPQRRGDHFVFVSCGHDVTASLHEASKLAESELVLRSLLDNLLDPVITIGPTGTIWHVGGSVYDVLGYEPGELLGKSVNLLMPEPYRSEHDEYLARYSRTGQSWILGTTRTFDVLRRDGEAITCELSVSRVDIPGRDEPLFCGSFRNVTARVRADRALTTSERRFRAVFDQEFQYVGILELDGKVVEVNETALVAAGAEREAVIGRPFWETAWWSHSAVARERVQNAVEQAAGGKFVRFETDFRARDGEVGTVDFSLKGLEDNEGRTTQLLAEGREITALKRAQQAETAMLRALASIGESAAVLAHEIKNPITAVNTALRAVARQLGEDDQAVLHELSTRMKHLEHLMTRTLSFARPLDLQCSACDLAEPVRSAIATLRTRLAEDDVEVELRLTEGCPLADADSALLQDLVSNLLRNALEAFEAEAEGAKHIRVTVEAGDASDVQLMVEDSGPGIAESMRSTLFQPFVTSKEQGTGLGLAVCRKIAEEHGGHLTATASEDLGGAAFQLRLPAI